ncbi:hypothetical protein BCR35DRAFT_308584 [Leucosporidium creatinivorum]|uniref:Uncharacterized protein n=1 Tax=Leucosporidium creatinivorum TaxID=106004 RepID=A0A1Y2E2R2_9BASI|nr:hypothetical protein BCR35DRAFT_308584 [Leucosporidium creatinivorum]
MLDDFRPSCPTSLLRRDPSSRWTSKSSFIQPPLCIACRPLSFPLPTLNHPPSACLQPTLRLGTKEEGDLLLLLFLGHFSIGANLNILDNDSRP